MPQNNHSNMQYHWTIPINQIQMSTHAQSTLSLQNTSKIYLHYNYYIQQSEGCIDLKYILN